MTKYISFIFVFIINSNLIILFIKIIKNSIYKENFSFEMSQWELIFYFFSNGLSRLMKPIQTRGKVWMLSDWLKKSNLTWKRWDQIESQNLTSGHLKVQDKLSKIECEVSDSFWCLQWRCEKYQEHQMSKLDVSQQDENIDIYYLCKNWISLSQFFIEWLLPAIRLLQLNCNTFHRNFRPDAIDLSLCKHRKTDKGVLEILKLLNNFIWFWIENWNIVSVFRNFSFRGHP